MTGMVPARVGPAPDLFTVLMGHTHDVDVGPPLRDIGCFALVAAHLSFSRAATDLGMSQPAVSQAVARLERTVGVRLFERSSREVTLTDAGKVLLPYAEALLDQAGAFSAEAARLATAPEETIRLAYCPLVGTLAARVARRVAVLAPGLEVELRPAGWAGATADLTQRAATAAFMSTPFPPGLAATARFHLPITHLAVPTGSPLASAGRLRPDQLVGRDVLLPRSWPRNSVWAGLAARLPPRATSPSAAVDLDDLPAALDLVAAGRGLLVVPDLLVETTRRPDIRFIPLDGLDLRMTYALVWRTDGAVPGLTTLVRAVQEIMRAGVGGHPHRTV
jgi:DNA-binding transcriptional LysR family regulator